MFGMGLGRMGLTRLGRGGGAAAITALTVLSKYGTNAWMWIPGVGTISGFDAKNWLNSNYTTSVAVDQQVGSVSSSSPAGTIGLAQSTAGSRPYLRETGGVYSWEFDGTDDRLQLSAAPFSMPSDHTLMVACTPTTSATTKTLFSIRGTGRIEISHSATNQFTCQWIGTGTVNLTPPVTVLDTPAVITAAYSGNVASVRLNGANIGEVGHTPSTWTPTSNNFIGATSAGIPNNHYKGRVHGAVLIASAILPEELGVLEAFLAAMAGTTVASEGVPTYFNTAGLMDAFMGYYTNTSGVLRMERNQASMYLNIKAEKAIMFCGSGDANPYQVLVDSLDFTASAIPAGMDSVGTVTTTAANIRKIELFSGELATRKVLITSDNSLGGNQFGDAVSGKLLALYGNGVEVSKVGKIYYTTDPACPGILSNPVVAQATWLPAFPRPTSGTLWQARHVGSFHFRAVFEEIYVYTGNQEIEVSIDGGPFARYSLTPRYTVAGALNRNWRKLPITGDGTTLRSVILSGCGSSLTSSGMDGEIRGLMLTGSAADLQAPSGTRRHVTQFGASQTEGVSSGGLVDTHLVQDRLPIYALTAGWAGKAVVDAIAGTTFQDWAATITNKDILLLSIGINDDDDANFQPNYQTLIGKALTAGFNKVICRGLGFPVSTFASKNTKIAAAVTAAGDARVVYASVDAWTDPELNDVHPDRAGYVIMANNSVRDHAALYA